MVTHAMKGADVAFGLVGYPSIWRHPGAVEAMKLHKCRYMSLATMCSFETLASDACTWPMEIYWKIVEKMEALAKSVKKVRVTNPRGTDITADFDPLYAKLGVSRGSFQKGSMGVFPAGDSRMYPVVPDPVTFQPMPSGEGVIVFDGFYQYGLLAEPIRMSVEKGWVTKIEGGSEAKELADYLSQYDNSLHFNEISWGHNPRMPLQLWDKMLIQANRASSVVHLGVGDALMDGGKICSKVKPAGSILYRPSLYLDQQPVVRDGRLLLLDDPEVIEVAARCGDPQRWLTELEVYGG
jgi:leucyl aminopeptidase (aminopeptidase T)